MVEFKLRHINRIQFPKYHILVCEDDLECQTRIAKHLTDLFGPQSETHVSFVAGGVAAAAILKEVKVHLILLDYDMPWGNGLDLFRWLEESKMQIPIITFSGVATNNDTLVSEGVPEKHRFMKEDVIHGHADKLISEILEKAQ